MRLLDGGLNVATMVIGFGMSATFVVLICARLICGRSRSAASRSDLELRADLAQPEHIISGLEHIVVAAFPTMIYNHGALHSSEISLCSICLGEYQDKEVLRVMPSCGHRFHLDCIDVWLQKHSTCPICRLALNDSFNEKLAASSLLHFLQTVDSPFSVLDRPS